jgi:nitrite reductase/ring-hydroxylating ferredoxin subunit
MAYVRLIPLSECRTGAGTFVRHADLKLAVFRLTNPDRIAVIDSECPHAGGDLSRGEVTGTIVTCPWHQWRFDLLTGISTHSERARVRCYAAEIRDDTVWVDLPD